MIGRAHFKPDHGKFWWNYDQNIVSVTGARSSACRNVKGFRTTRVKLTCIITLIFLVDMKLINSLGRVTHICVCKITIIGSDNDLLPGRRQAIIWTNDGILLIRTLGRNFSQFLNEIHTFSFKKIPLKMSSAKWRPFCLGLNVLNNPPRYGHACLAAIIGITVSVPYHVSKTLMIDLTVTWIDIPGHCGY